MTIRIENERRNNREDNLKRRLNSKGQPKFLSYHPSTAVHLYMKGGKVADGFYQSMLCSIADNVMGWPFFLGFASIENNEEEKEV